MRNIGKHEMFLNFVGNIFARFSGSKFCLRNNVSTGGQTGKHLRKHRESQMFPRTTMFPSLPRALKVGSSVGR